MASNTDCNSSASGCSDPVTDGIPQSHNSLSRSCTANLSPAFKHAPSSHASRKKCTLGGCAHGNERASPRAASRGSATHARMRRSSRASPGCFRNLAAARAPFTRPRSQDPDCGFGFEGLASLALERHRAPSLTRGPYHGNLAFPMSSWRKVKGLFWQSGEPEQSGAELSDAEFQELLSSEHA